MNADASVVRLSLPRDFVGQVLDGLHVLVEQWEETATYLEHGEVAGENVVIRDCSNAYESMAIAQYYRDIAVMIENQLTTNRS